MAIDMFINIDGVPGESIDKVHKGHISLLSWSWGSSQSGTTHDGPGGGSGKVTVQDVVITKHIDSSSDRKSTRLNSSHLRLSRMPSSA